MTHDHKIYLYPLWLRIWHALNAVGILILIATGIIMQFSNPSFTLMNFELAVNLHNISGIVVSANYILFIIGNRVTKNHSYYKLKLKGLYTKLELQIIYYTYGIFKNQSPPFPISEKRKFNPMQKVAYLMVMYLFVPGLIVTGLGLLFPELILENIYQLSGIFLTAILHASLGFLTSIFLIIHLYVASIGKYPLNTFRSIINGYHDTEGH